MTKSVAIGIQDFETIRRKKIFYIDKTDFIKEWWENEDEVTLITRPRRFGKTLNISMLNYFFSNRYSDRKDLFEGLNIWKNNEYRKLQGTYPVISLSFANVKERSYESAVYQINTIIEKLYLENDFLLNGALLKEKEKNYYQSISSDMKEAVACIALHNLSDYLSRFYEKKVIILLDEYDTPMQEAYVYGYLEKLIQFIRSLFNSSFKTNPYLERALMTGITRVSRESMFSDLNNMEIVTTTVEKYETAFGFTQEEVFMALEEKGFSDKKEEIKKWYDGFTFGNVSDIYNPWSIINYLNKGKFETYWANTSSNSLADRLIRRGNSEIKIAMEDLIQNKTFCEEIDEQICYYDLESTASSVWSLLLAGGYLKVEEVKFDEITGRKNYKLSLTNFEVKIVFEKMIRLWFSDRTEAYNEFVKALLKGDIKTMNLYINKVALSSFSFFDTGKHPSEHTEPERFYHGFVLGLIVDLNRKYRVTSNRESGFGRYDVVLEPIENGIDAIIIEFKVKEEEETLSDTVASALNQIEEKKYDADLLASGIEKEHIRHYGFAFHGKKVLIGTD